MKTNEEVNDFIEETEKKINTLEELKKELKKSLVKEYIRTGVMFSIILGINFFYMYFNLISTLMSVIIIVVILITLALFLSNMNKLKKIHDEIFTIDKGIMEYEWQKIAAYLIKV